MSAFHKSVTSPIPMPKAAATPEKAQSQYYAEGLPGVRQAPVSLAHFWNAPQLTSRELALHIVDQACISADRSLAGSKRKRDESSSSSNSDSDDDDDDAGDHRPAKATKAGPFPFLSVDVGQSFMNCPEILQHISLRHLSSSPPSSRPTSSTSFFPPRPLGAPLHDGPVMARPHPSRGNARVSLTNRTSDTGADRALDRDRLVDTARPAWKQGRSVLKRPREDTLGEREPPAKRPRTDGTYGPKEVHFNGHVQIYASNTENAEVERLPDRRLPALPRGRVPNKIGAGVRSRGKMPESTVFMQRRHGSLFYGVTLVDGRPYGRPKFNFDFARWLKAYTENATKEIQEQHMKHVAAREDRVTGLISETKGQKARIKQLEDQILDFEAQVQDLEATKLEMESNLTEQARDRRAGSGSF